MTDLSIVTKHMLEALLELSSPCKKNKVRKIVCKRASCTWDDFSASFDALAKDGTVKEITDDDGGQSIGWEVDSVMIAQTAHASAKAAASEAQVVAASKTKSEKAAGKSFGVVSGYSITKEEKIPVPIAIYLMKKKGQKLNNIETNGKCSVDIKGDYSEEQWNNTVQVKIAAAEEKHITFAWNLINKMISSFKENPDHFLPTGGRTTQQKELQQDIKAKVLEEKGQRAIKQAEQDSIAKNIRLAAGAAASSSSDRKGKAGAPRASAAAAAAAVDGGADETIICRQCSKPFIFTIGEQRFFAQKGYETKPVRCKECLAQFKHKGAEPKKFGAGVSKAKSSGVGEAVIAAVAAQQEESPKKKSRKFY